MRYDTIIFDLDGTLIDTLDDLTDNLNYILREEGFPERTRSQVEAAVGEGYRVMLTKSLPSETTEQVITHCTNKFETRYAEHLIDRTKPYEGIPTLLLNLKEAGYKIGVVSNKMEKATKEICQIFFESLIDVAVGDTPQRRRKPAPDNVWEALRQLESKPFQALYIGDSNIDVHTAREAGLDFVGVTWGFRTREVLQKEGASRFIDTPEQLLKML